MDRATSITIYNKTPHATRSGKLIYIWTAKVGKDTIQAYTLKGCKIRVEQYKDRQLDILDFSIDARIENAQSN